MSVFDHAERIGPTVESVLGQSYERLELVIVNDGSVDGLVASTLSSYARRENRIVVIDKHNQGLTRALIDAFARCKGELIARIDSGDLMTADRLARQVDALTGAEDCVLATARTEFLAPEWEHLWFTPLPANPRGRPPLDALDGTAGIDVPHHGSVMFRRDAYERSGGYRRQFYYGQDWDLWYRLAELGDFIAVPDVLYRARIFPRSISMEQATRQREIAACSLGAARARCAGEDETPWLDRAASIGPMNAGGRRHSSAEPGFYFIGETLRRNGNPACRRYLASAILERPASLRAWIRWVASLSLAFRSTKTSHGWEVAQ